MQNVPFESRFKVIMQKVPYLHPFIVSFNALFLTPPLFYSQDAFKIQIIFYYYYITASRNLCGDRKRLVLFAKMVLKKGGEGLILRRPLSLYERGRSDSLFKLKV